MSASFFLRATLRSRTRCSCFFRAACFFASRRFRIHGIAPFALSLVNTTTADARPNFKGGTQLTRWLFPQPSLTMAGGSQSTPADTDEAGHAFQFEAGHLFRPEAGRRSDLMSATGGLLPRIELDDVSVVWIGQDRIDFTAKNAAFANSRRRD